MSLVVVEQASLSFGGQTVFDDVNLRITAGEHIGLIGPNGSGKSTLLKVLANDQALDGGDVRYAKQTRIGYLPQDVLALAGESVLAAVMATIPGRMEIEAQLQMIQDGIMATEDVDEQMTLAEQLVELQSQLDHFETYYSERQALSILRGLGFSEAMLAKPTRELSGGWKMRVALAGLLFQHPDLLLLDEPTNHLDIPSVLWLDDFLKSYHGAWVLICHDRSFLNRHSERVVSFEPEGVRSYRGNYDDYLIQREAEQEILEARTRNQEKKMQDLERFVERFKAKASKARQAQSRAKQIERLEKEIERPVVLPKTLKFRFPPTARTGRDVATIEEVEKSFGPLTLYKKVTCRIAAGDRIAIVGVNGAGKTTLLKMLAGELAPDAGSIRFGSNVERGYYAQHHTELLNARNTVLQEVRQVLPNAPESTVRGICGAFLFSGDTVEKTIGVLSGGERARVLLARLLAHPGNLLLMDEPTNHLDIASAEALAEALEEFDGTVIFVSHNTAFINRLATKVWDVSNQQVVEYLGNLDDYLRKTAAQKAPEQSAAVKPSPTKSHKGANANKKSDAPDRQLKKVRDTIKELEQRIAELEASQREIEPKLADPSVYAQRGDFDRLWGQFSEQKTKLEELYQRWEFQQTQLTDLTERTT